jgi:hypothetical protein
MKMIYIKRKLNILLHYCTLKLNHQNFSSECTASAEVGERRASVPGSLDGTVPSASHA